MNLDRTSDLVKQDLLWWSWPFHTCNILFQWPKYVPFHIGTDLFLICKRIRHPPLQFIHESLNEKINREKLMFLLAEANLGKLQSPPPKCCLSSRNYQGVAKSPLLLLWPPHQIVSSIALNFLQYLCLPNGPSLICIFPLMNKLKGSHHQEMEGCCGNLLVDPWPPQDRSDDHHGVFMIHERLPSPCYHPNEMDHLLAWQSIK